MINRKYLRFKKFERLVFFFFKKKKSTDDSVPGRGKNAPRKGEKTSPPAGGGREKHPHPEEDGEGMTAQVWAAFPASFWLVLRSPFFRPLLGVAFPSPPLDWG